MKPRSRDIEARAQTHTIEDPDQSFPVAQSVHGVMQTHTHMYDCGAPAVPCRHDVQVMHGRTPYRYCAKAMLT